MLQILSIAFAEVKVSNTSENLLCEWNLTNHIFFELSKKKLLKKYTDYNNFSKFTKQKWILYLRILEIVKHPILTDYYSVFRQNKLKKEAINMLPYQILAFTIHGKI